jgi:hypothetical protein
MQSLTEVNIQAFAEAVRAELADLPKREIQDLTDGLEADLAEKFAEEGVDFANVSAADYAAELRDAAGVAPKAPRRKAFSSKAFMQNSEDWFRKTAFGSALLEFCISIRPVWWVLRVVVMFVILGAFRLPLWLFPVAVFLSIMWGRGIWFNNRFFKSIILPLNLVAILLIIPAADSVTRTIDQYIANTDLVQSTDYANRAGLQLNGEQVLEVKAFDAKGVEVLGLTYQDQNGNPLFEAQATPIEIPDISGMTIPEFQAALTAVGIENVEINYFDESEPTDDVVVLRTEPAIGSWLDPKSTLLVVVDHQK